MQGGGSAGADTKRSNTPELGSASAAAAARKKWQTWKVASPKNSDNKNNKRPIISTTVANGDAKNKNNNNTSTTERHPKKKAKTRHHDNGEDDTWPSAAVEGDLRVVLGGDEEVGASNSLDGHPASPVPPALRKASPDEVDHHRRHDNASSRPGTPAPASLDAEQPSHRPSGLYGEVTNKSWTDVQPSLSACVLEVLTKKLHFERMTPVQASAIPLFLSYKDVCVEACTGSGKTLAFLVPVFEMLLRREEGLKKHEVGALIITPTRELAMQINEIAKVFITHLQGTPGKQSFTLQLFIGGVGLSQDMKKFQEEGGHIIIGTPGRLEDIINKMDHVFNTRNLEVLILDEADRLLEMGFRPQINTILNRLPKQRRTGLFSATQTQEVEHLARAGLRNPMYVGVKVKSKNAQVKNQKIPLALTNWFMMCESDEKLSQLCHFIANHASEKIIIYFLTCACVDYFYKAMLVLRKAKFIPENFELYSLHGKVPNNKRPIIFNKFTAERRGCALLATDLAARGLDVPDVDWIIQYDPPQDPDTFVHRIGRSARMGREGNALAFIMPHENDTSSGYIDFMKFKGVPFKEMSKASEVKDTLPIVRQAATKDRELMEKSKLAFVSFIRGYKEHHYKYIFVFERLNLGKLAMSFAQLRLPSMPELKNKKIDDFTPVDIDLDTVPFTDKKKEKQRKAKLAARKKEAEEQRSLQLNNKPSLKNSTPWSRNQLKKEKRDKRKMLKENKRKRISELKNQEKSGKREEDDNDDDDWKELEKDMAEERLLKKLKRGKISKAEFERRTGEKDLEDEFEKELAEE